MIFGILSPFPYSSTTLALAPQPSNTLSAARITSSRGHTDASREARPRTRRPKRVESRLLAQASPRRWLLLVGLALFSDFLLVLPACEIVLMQLL